MYEINEYEKILLRWKKSKQYKDIYNLCKKLYGYEFISDNIIMTYGQCLILKGDFEEAKEVFESLYNSGYLNYSVLASLVHIYFELYDYEGAFSYLEILKKFCNKRQLRELIPFEIYLYDVMGLNSDKICKTKSAFYLRNQINSYDKMRAMDFIKYKSHYNYLGFNSDMNFEGLFYLSLNHVVEHDRELQFNPFGASISFFDHYYMDIGNLSLSESPYKYAEISTLPFSNHICMIKPSNSDRTIKKLELSTI